MTERVDAVVIGGGVVGLAVARALSLAGREVLILEAGSAIGTGTSSRNSEVIHAGLYYPAGSLKAVTCVAGREALYAYAADRGFAARAVGKLLVATDETQLAALADIETAARRNGVTDLVRLSADEVRRKEPQIRCAGGLFSPRSGIVDSHAFMLALLGDVENAGGLLALLSPVSGGRIRDGGVELDVGGAEPMRILARDVVNAAGLGAMRIARSIAGLVVETLPTLHLAKGSYFSLTGLKAPFRHLVYPLPEPGGLGIHATLDMGGQVRFGPDVAWVETEDYTVDTARGASFYAAIRRYWPALPDGALTPSYSGIRPKLSGPGEGSRDFVVQGPGDHGIPGLWNLFGIESPGLTASLALADHVVKAISDQMERSDR